MVDLPAVAIFLDEVECDQDWSVAVRELCLGLGSIGGLRDDGKVKSTRVPVELTRERVESRLPKLIVSNDRATESSREAFRKIRADIGNGDVEEIGPVKRADHVQWRTEFLGLGKARRKNCQEDEQTATHGDQT